MGQFRFVGQAALEAKAMRALTRATAKCAHDLEGRAKEAAPYKTGTLEGSIHAEDPKASGTTVTAEVKTGGEADEYAVYQHEGTSRGVPATKFLEGPLLEMAPVYIASLQAAMKGEF